MNGEAAHWVEQNVERLPLDRVNMQVDEMESGPAPAAPPVMATVVAEDPPLAAPPPPPPPAEIRLGCPGCGHQFRVPAQHAGKRVRCSHCQQIIAIPGVPKQP